MYNVNALFQKMDENINFDYDYDDDFKSSRTEHLWNLL